MASVNRSHSRRLRRALESGAVIVCTLPAYEGLEVEYAPAYPTQKEPWVLRSKAYKPPDSDEFEILERFSGKECRAVYPTEPEEM